MITNYPLDWPLGYPRTKNKKKAKFKSSIAKARDFIIAELKRFGADHTIVSTNIPLKRDGMFYGSLKPDDGEVGVAVYFHLDGKPIVLCCDAWDRIEDNLHAIGLTIEAMRGQERWGVSDVRNRQFSGFEALPEKSLFNPYVVLGISESATPDQIKAAYRSLVISHHPDTGGDQDTYVQIVKAYQSLTNAGS